ncbi:MAG: two-component system, NarL family, nitrate/nitrite response regulator NarL [Thermoleophilaceae bacterium]|jgi:DNA-binding CsgD family transcriptional regulator|nr:two-component system, NarL family, nitrate/nitrite response regulator NarL [Thermoleophilaceae bacterium]
MDLDTNTVTAILSALGLAHEHGGAKTALTNAGIDLHEIDRFQALSDDFQRILDRAIGDESVSEALALGYLAGSVAQRPRTRTRRTVRDPTSFVMDEELVVQSAQGESILRLPWFEEDLFVGRQLPDVSEMPARVRGLAVEHYRAALAGEHGRFSFTSYGHAYSVEAVPVHGDDGTIHAVLGIATPARSFASAGTAYQRTAERLDRAATMAERRAEGHRAAGRSDAESAQLHEARKARAAAERAKANAGRMRSRETGAGLQEAPLVTPREVEVLNLASHGLTSAEIAEALAVTPATIKTHLENIYPKLGVSDKAAAVAAALRHGLIQ